MDGSVDIAIDAWEGPLALLLDEARRRRIDLAKISISELVDACLERLASIPSTTEKADCLIVAATLAEMKARLLLPEAEADADADEEERLRARLRELSRIRDRAARLMARDRLGRDVWPRGMPELEKAPRRLVRAEEGEIDLLGLVRAYARIRLRDDAETPLELRRVLAMTLKEGLEALGIALPHDGEWADLVSLASAVPRGAGVSRRSAIAAGFVAALEMARTGEAEISQAETFGKLIVRRGKAQRQDGPIRLEAGIPDA